MPKQTFFNLSEQKRKQITDAFLREFAVKAFDEASITIVVKQLGIAKGSIYQYFEDKLDLYRYLIGLCSALKQQYVASIERNNYPDYWAYFRALYEHGFLFDQENPLESHFLHNLTQNLYSPSIKDLYEQMLQQIVTGFEAMVKYEVEAGRFRADIPIRTMGFLLYKIGVSIQEELAFSGLIQPQKSIQQNLPVYQGKKTALMNTVEHYIQLAQAAFNKT